MRKFFILSVCVLFLLATFGFGQDLNIGQELNKAKSKKTVGLVLMISGGVILASSMYFTFADKIKIYTSERHYIPPPIDLYTYTWTLIDTKIKTLYIVGDVVGLVSGIVGLAIHLSAVKKLKRLNSKVVADIGILPEFNAVGVRLRINF